MLEFTSSDPFPLIGGSGDRGRVFSYVSEKKHSEQVDAWLGFEIEEIENALLGREHGAVLDDIKDKEFWIGRSPQAFMTPYTELRAILKDLSPAPGDVVVDLGAGYGRMAHVMAAHYSEVSFLGYEYVKPRQKEGLRVLREHGVHQPYFGEKPWRDLIWADVVKLNFCEDVALRQATHFFIYDFGSIQDVEKCLENLKPRARHNEFHLVARGGRTRNVIEREHPWLSQVVSPLHREHYSIYRSG
ncbi:MAG: hypothetical protein RBT63_00875 [Bdellovibrionales bacterium]|jgi:hypothetical protein|nr:hypothetical protein [Bdellovibrionales bacterium]